MKRQVAPTATYGLATGDEHPPRTYYYGQLLSRSNTVTGPESQFITRVDTEEGRASIPNKSNSLKLIIRIPFYPMY